MEIEFSLTASQCRNIENRIIIQHAVYMLQSSMLFVLHNYMVVHCVVCHMNKINYSPLGLRDSLKYRRKEKNTIENNAAGCIVHGPKQVLVIDKLYILIIIIYSIVSVSLFVRLLIILK